MSRISLHPPRAAPIAAIVIALIVLTLSLAVMAFDVQRMLGAARRHGDGALAGARALQGVLAAAQAQDTPARLVSINHFYNHRIVFTDDLEAWGETDRWTTPLELLERGRGDCEDYAIAKYFSLIAAGLPAATLRLVYVRATIAGGTVQPHMVLAYYREPQAEPLILDNLVGEVWPASRRADLAPVFSFNGEGLWQGVGAARAGDPVARLSRWREVLAKARAEGFQ